MELEIASADPAGNITVFVLTPVAGSTERAAVVQALLADPVLKAEQAGFVIPPAGFRLPLREYAAGDREAADKGENGLRGLWRLEMMGGEFCGNAARSFGLLVAARTGLTGSHSLMIEISGMARPLQVHIDTLAGTAAADIPGPAAETEVEYQGRRLPVYMFEGISHVIAEDMEPGRELAAALLEKLEKECSAYAGHLADAGHSPNALGVMFFDTREFFMRPVVYVRTTGTTVFESSCGSGSAALGVWAARKAHDTDECFKIAQPGGLIEVRVVKRGGRIQHISIGGPVNLNGPFRFSV